MTNELRALGLQLSRGSYGPGTPEWLAGKEAFEDWIDAHGQGCIGEGIQAAASTAQARHDRGRGVHLGWPVWAGLPVTGELEAKWKGDWGLSREGLSYLSGSVYHIFRPWGAPDGF